MEIYLKNTLAGLIPLYNSDLAEKKKLKIDREYKAKITNPRNIKFHKKLFALLNLGHQNTRINLPFEAYRARCIMKAGYVHIYETPNGTMFLPESISFASMSEDIFSELYSRILTVIITDVGTTKEDIERELINFF